MGNKNTIQNSDELKQHILSKGIKCIYIRDCSICGYELCYKIDGEKLSYDTGCYCMPEILIELRNWEELWDFFDHNSEKNNLELMGEERAKFNARFGL